MARKPNYDFERKERERLKKLKKADRAETKHQRPTSEPEKAAPAKTPTDD